MKAITVIALLLMPFTAYSAPCSDTNDETRITGASQCLLYRHYGSANAESLLIWLHGDVSSGGPANYHFALAEKVAEKFSPNRVHSIALVRPGYPDGDGESSSVDPSQEGRSDHYTKENIAEVAGAIRGIKERYSAKHVTLIGHSGGAATAALLLGMYPGLAEGAVLVSCPCDLVAWRKNRGKKTWARSQNPIDWADKVTSSTRIVALTGSRDENTTPEIAKHFVDVLRAKNVAARFSEIEGASHNDAFRSEEVSSAIEELIRASAP